LTWNAAKDLVMEKDNDGVVKDYAPASTGRRSEGGIRRRLSVIVEIAKSGNRYNCFSTQMC
jgi:hypothetical protein